ncbi:MAG: flagellin [Methylobacter sp.]|nr:flagellin [Methylobacter sp.]MDP2097054.1 flagellin [Methylobacter sp.]MDP2427992.1 flagellin [Methylobacter sp.]MDP3055888.1 flagellin [Methylobacter sp.]MDP3390885.1 flagellin [Methylococcaceae bacterium]
MVINTNIASINSQRQLNKTNNNLATSMERLSSGLRINSAKDDAAGLAISNRMTSQIRGMTVAARNANDGISMAQTAEAAMGALTDTMQRMRDLAVQSANEGGVTTGDKEKMQTEFNQLNLELTRIINNTNFNGKKILNGDLSGGVALQVGANTAADNQISIEINDLSLAITSVTAASIGSTQTTSGVLAAITSLDTAIASIDNSRAKLGAVQSRFTATIANLQSSIENQSAARSRITDTDFAMETANLSRNQILQQAGTAMLAQANQSKQGVMQLLQ